MYKYPISFIALLIAFYIHNRLLADPLSFNHYNTQNGLSNNGAMCGLQDQNGFIWIGTEEGLNRFDGYEFKVFINHSNDSTSISSNTIFGLLLDSKKRLWVAGNLGIDLYDYSTMSFKHLPIVPNEGKIYYRSYTSTIVEDKNGNVIISNTNGIFIYNEKNKVFNQLNIKVPVFQTSMQEGVRSMFVDSKNRLWVASVGNGLFIYDLNLKKVIVSPNNFDIPASNRILAITENDKGHILLGTDMGIFMVKNNLTGYSSITENFTEFPKNIDNITALYIDNDYLYIGRNGSGMSVFNMKTQQISTYYANKSDKNALHNDIIKNFFKDNQGQLWICTYYEGVNLTQVNKLKNFKLIQHNPLLINSLNNNSIAAICEDQLGRLWIGSDGGGLNMYDPKTNKFTFFNYHSVDNKINTEGSVLALAIDRNDRVWFGGFQSGVEIIDLKNNTTEHLKFDPKEENALWSEDIWDIYIDSQNIAWIVTNGGGLNKYDIANKKFTHYQSGRNNSIASNWCIKIFEASDGKLWIGTYLGLSVFDPVNEVFINYHSDDKTKYTISNDWVYSFAEDKNNNIWVGTANGLNCFHKNANIIDNYYVSNGLPNGVINGLLIDNDNQLWLSTNNGLAKFNLADTIITAYDERDGIQGNQFINGSYFESDNGKLYFGGNNGLTYFYPDSIKDNSYIPPIQFTDFLLSFKPVPIGQGSPLLQSINSIDHLTLKHNQSTFTIKYTALNYINTSKNKFAYKLAPYDKDWNYVGDRREATYNNLPPGNYTFTVIGSNNDGIWNYTGKSINIKITPPWYKTLLFRLISILLTAGLAFIFYQVRTEKLRRHKIYLENEVSARTSEILEKNRLLKEQTEQLNQQNELLFKHKKQVEQQADELRNQKEELVKANFELKELNSTKDKFFSIIAHDLKNPFLTIIGFTELLSSNYNSFNDLNRQNFIEAIHNSANKVYNLLENLLNWAQSQTKRIKINQEPLHINSLINNNIILSREIIKQKEINLDTDINEDYIVFADNNMVNTVLRNLISNAIKFSQPRKKISIKTNISDEIVIVSISDQGIGIPQTIKANLFSIDVDTSRKGTNGETGTGLGLLLCKEFIEKNNGNIWVESIENQGSTFSFSLPLYFANSDETVNC